MGVNVQPGDIVFTCLCDEPEGAVERTIRHFGFTQENILKLWNKASKFPTFMGNEINTPEDMMNIFATYDAAGNIVPKGLCLVVDDFVGIFYLTDINGLQEASVHYTFFDRRHKGRLQLCRKAIKFAFDAFQFHRLYTSVPVHSPFILKFVEDIGFQLEGRLYRSRLLKGKYYDVNIYGILKEEANEWKVSEDRKKILVKNWNWKPSLSEETTSGEK